LSGVTFADGDHSITASATDSAGNASGSSAIAAFTLDTRNTTAITIDPITGDNTVTAAEAGQVIAVTGTVTGEAQAGDTVYLTVGGHEYTAAVVDSNGSLTYSIDVPGSVLADASSISASVTTTDAAGNIATATDSLAYTVITDTGGSGSQGDQHADDDSGKTDIDHAQQGEDEDGGEQYADEDSSEGSLADSDQEEEGGGQQNLADNPSGESEDAGGDYADLVVPDFFTIDEFKLAVDPVAAKLNGRGEVIKEGTPGDAGDTLDIHDLVSGLPSTDATKLFDKGFLAFEKTDVDPQADSLTVTLKLDADGKEGPQQAQAVGEITFVGAHDMSVEHLVEHLTNHNQIKTEG
jgi:hypothetical protein